MMGIVLKIQRGKELGQRSQILVNLENTRRLKEGEREILDK